MPERADHPPSNSREPEWVATIPDESDRAAVRAVLARKRWRESAEPPIDSQWGPPCDITGCERPAEWRLLGTEGKPIGFCTYHRDLIEDQGLDLIEDA